MMDAWMDRYRCVEGRKERRKTFAAISQFAKELEKLKGDICRQRKALCNPTIPLCQRLWFRYE